MSDIDEGCKGCSVYELNNGISFCINERGIDVRNCVCRKCLIKSMCDHLCKEYRKQISNKKGLKP